MSRDTLDARSRNRLAAAYADRPVSPPSELTDAEKLRVLATWFDNFDDWREATAKIAPGISEYREVQRDLRRIATTLDAAPVVPAALDVEDWEAIDGCLSACANDPREKSNYAEWYQGVLAKVRALRADPR
jgi:hypothetical protein